MNLPGEPARTEEETDRRWHAVQAVQHNMTDDLRETGWAQVFATIEAGWTLFRDGKPASHLDHTERLAWVSLLGHHPASTIQAALRMWPATDSGQHCPKPAEVANMLAAHHAPVRPNSPHLALRPDQQPATLTLVANLLATKAEQMCDCAIASSELVIDERGVLWCPVCGGIEVGQAEAALELICPPPPSPVRELGSLVSLSIAREARRARESDESRGVA